MRSRTAVVAIVLAVAALLAAAGAWYAITTSQTAAAGKSLAQQVSETCARGGQAAAELGQACAKAAEVKDAPPVSQPTVVDPVELRQAAHTAVVDYCSAASQPCRGADGQTPNFELIVDAVMAKIPAPQKGTDGANATAEQVAAAVAAYCGQASEPCRGTPGTDGQNGKDGRDGVDGRPGPACPDGYELRDAVITARDGTTYSGKACVDPNSSAPPSSSTNPPPIGGS